MPADPTTTEERASAITEPMKAALGRRRSALLQMQRFFKEFGDAVDLPMDDPQAWVKVNGRPAFRITLDFPRAREGRSPYTRRRLRFHLSSAGYKDPKIHPWVEPEKGWTDGWLRQIALEIHQIGVDLAHAARLETEREKADRSMSEEAARINAELGIKPGEPGFVTVQHRQLRVQNLGWLSPDEARMIAACMRELHLARLEPRGGPDGS